MPELKERGGIPEAAEWGLLRAFLAKLGISQAQIIEAIGNSIGGRDRATIAAELREWLRNRPGV